jgi:hypothetical protein
MTLTRTNLVDPDLYDEALYTMLHQVVDRVIELGAKADTSEENEELAQAEEGDEGGSADFISILRSQANFTPAERAEFQATGAVLNLLINVAVSRRSGLYTIEEEINP